MAIRIITDSGSDMTVEEAKALGVILLPINVRFGDDEYKAGYDMSNVRFFDMLIETDEFPKTSSISPAVYEDAFREVLDSGDEAIYISLSSGLSGTMQSAMIAVSSVEDEYGRADISVVDSKGACGTQYILVRQALEYVEQGLDRYTIVERLQQDRKHTKIIAMLDTLEYLHKGGRISAAAATVGNMLSIKPVITFEDGQVKLLGKAKGSKNANNKLKQFVIEHGGIDFNREFILVYSGNETHLLDKYIIDSEELYADYGDELPRLQIGPVIGTYAGPGAVGLAFFEMTTES
ncbi:MAG: DegV family protein [Lachnospiraceae bacterium]|nr:DegV family protein [Lachnospiraceae bacterium]